MKKCPSLQTARLLLRPFELSDAPDVQRLAGDRDIADTTLNIPHPYKNGDAEEWISTHEPGFEKGELCNFAIVLSDTDELIGAIGLTVVKRFQRAEMGYWIGKPYWNRGYCTEACEAVLEFGFTELNLNRIYATYLTRNPASGRIMEKLGMTNEGLIRQHVIKWNQFEDIYLYGILKEEWKQKNNAM